MVFTALSGCENNSQEVSTRYLFLTDSIGTGAAAIQTIGYVKQIDLPEIYEVPTPCCGSGEALGRIEEIKTQIVENDIDTVWINVGMWDAVPGLTPRTPLDEYGQNIEMIFQELLDFGVDVIWCETTFTNWEFLNDYIFEANIIADELAMEYGIPIFEMSYVQEIRGWPFMFDGFHFTDETSGLIAMEVKEFLSN